VMKSLHLRSTQSLSLRANQLPPHSNFQRNSFH
jgi:hypothetical protein